MKRIIMMVLRNILFVPFLAAKLYYYAFYVDKYPEITRFKLLKKIVTRANKGGNVKVEAYGKENIPEENGWMFFPNHQGMYDVLALIDACPKPFSVVAKKEIGNIPVLKQVFACMNAFLIDRKDIRQSMEVIINVTNEVKKGRNYLIFAEGTRSKMGNNLLDFKGGSFKSAVKAKCPIIPVALIDSFKPFDTDSIQSVTVQVHFLKPLLYDEYKHMKTVEIAREVKRRIEEVIKREEMNVFFKGDNA